MTPIELAAMYGIRLVDPERPELGWRKATAGEPLLAPRPSRARKAHGGRRGRHDR